VAGVIEQFAPAFWQRHGGSLQLDQRKALQAILQCRTQALGGHRYACDCGHKHHAFHSCNHRLCPRCGASGTQEWVDKQLGKLLPVPYFMVTFTLPAQLRPVLYGNREAIESFLRCAGQALSELLADPSHCGFLRHGFFGVYQSWSQEMTFHPHLHYVVPAIGLDAGGKLKRLKDPVFLIHAKPLATRLRTLLCQRLLAQAHICKTVFWKLVKTDWNASVDPAGRGDNAVKYLGQYIRRSVISDLRILAIEGDQVRIRVKNRDNGSFETRLIPGVEFLRRFLLHVLPDRFHRIRYRGFLHARGKGTLQWLQLLLDAPILAPSRSPSPAPAEIRCPRCGAVMACVARMPRAPPLQRNAFFFRAIAA